MCDVRFYDHFRLKCLGGFFTPMQYVYMKKLRVIKNFELLSVTPVFTHVKNSNENSGYYADIIMHKDVQKTVKSFLDLRGNSWAFTNNNSLSSSISIQKLLRTHGENSSFFGNTIRTGNHLMSVVKVQNKQVTAAAVDSTAFYNYKNILHNDSNDICILDSIGPLPPYPIVCNKNLNSELKSKIIDALLHHTSKRTWGNRFKKFGLIKFTENSDYAYAEMEYIEPQDNQGLCSIYY
ncbi:uncharacterized protein LOC126907958 isoform X2 [Daktulosphaira vitifoliae]|uniref:uncharacterized protein LOC126907958 isoform X2 n=1 Tax=Daktulosphaira vitifoliae TaxID=58002 RepID=UPI0021AA4C89|nr:uncharacterized protein LOC126907958 isoform X2 [Daktulosphaira vitifoliae]